MYFGDGREKLYEAQSYEVGVGPLHPTHEHEDQEDHLDLLGQSLMQL